MDMILIKSRYSPGRIEGSLKEAARIHHDYEQFVLFGERDEHWAGFYAAYLLGQLGYFMEIRRLATLLKEVYEPKPELWAKTASELVSEWISL